MKFLLSMIIGMPITFIGCVLFSGGIAPVEGYVYRAFSLTYGFDILIAMPPCLLFGWIILEAVGYDD